MALIPHEKEEAAANFQFVYFAAMLVMFSLIHRLSQCQRLLWFPEASLQMLAGLFVTLLIIHFTGFRNSFSAELFFLILLPPIMFNSGLDVNIKYFYRNFFTIMVFANIGTLINTLVVGGLCYRFGADGLSEGISQNEAYSFGALISATDPVTTIAVFDSLRVEPHLYTIVVGVSILDDAVAVILFDLFAHYHSGSANAGVVFAAIGHFIAKLFVSMLLGYAFGIAFAWYLKKNPQLTQRVPLYLASVVTFVYCSYLLGEASTLSGIITTMFSAIAIRKYYELWSPDSFAILKHGVNGWSYVFESMVFFNIGLTLVRHRPKSTRDFQFIGWSLFACFVGRVVQIYPLSYLLNSYNTRPIVVSNRKTGHSVAAIPTRRGSKTLISTDDDGPRSWNGSQASVPTTGRTTITTTEVETLTTSASATTSEPTATTNTNETNSNAIATSEVNVASTSHELTPTDIDPSSCAIPPPKSLYTAPRELLRKRGVVLSWGYQHMILFAGLRGPIAYATARLISTDSEHRGMFIAATNFTVAVTTFILGALTVPALHWFDIKYGDAVAAWEKQQEEELEAAERLILAESTDEEEDGGQHSPAYRDLEAASIASTTGAAAGTLPDLHAYSQQRATKWNLKTLTNSWVSFYRLWHWHMTTDEILELTRHYECELVTRHFQPSPPPPSPFGLGLQEHLSSSSFPETNISDKDEHRTGIREHPASTVIEVHSDEPGDGIALSTISATRQHSSSHSITSTNSSSTRAKRAHSHATDKGINSSNLPTPSPQSAVAKKRLAQRETTPSTTQLPPLKPPRIEAFQKHHSQQPKPEEKQSSVNPPVSPEAESNGVVERATVDSSPQSPVTPKEALSTLTEHRNEDCPPSETTITITENNTEKEKLTLEENVV